VLSDVAILQGGQDAAMMGRRFVKSLRMIQGVDRELIVYRPEQFQQFVQNFIADVSIEQQLKLFVLLPEVITLLRLCLHCSCYLLDILGVRWVILVAASGMLFSRACLTAKIEQPRTSA
jgi:hypothetical protein